MKSIFERETRDEITRRINSLDENSAHLWGKMNVYQMLKHCTLWDKMTLEEIKVKRMFIGRLFGKIALKGVLKNDNPLKKNTPTVSALIIKEKNGDIASQKKEWITCITKYGAFDNPGFIHPFFGGMTRAQIGFFVYKHADHHLRQFNC